MSANNILFRASSMGKIMTGVKKGIPVSKSKTTIKELVKMVRLYKYNRSPKFSNKYTKKGIECENDSIDLYCIHKGEFYKKNEDRLNNIYFTGECDLFKGESFAEATETIDTKTSWSMDTFPSFAETDDDDYVYQGNVYMDLSKAHKHTIAHCLVNTPPTMILDAKFRAKKEFNIIDLETPEYIEKCKEIERESIFDLGKFVEENPWFELHHSVEEWVYDIPANKRVNEAVIMRDDDLITRMKARVSECRTWIDEHWEKL